MSRSATVDQSYRLSPADLRGRPREVVITNVTYQGLEELTPVLHFQNQNKRLLLSPEQWRSLVHITGASESSDWIGQSVLLKPQHIGGQWVIVLDKAGPGVPWSRRSAAIPAEEDDDRSHWRMALLTVGVLLLISLIYTFLNPSLLSAFMQIIGGA